MEGYILGGRNIPAQSFKAQFRRENGLRELRAFEDAYCRTFIQEDDFRRIASWGANGVRLPFHYAFLEKKPYQYDTERLAFLKTVLQWAEKHSLKVILDLHAACGSQNHDWHSDSRGSARLWQNRKFQERTAALWEYLASALKDSPALYGYDLLNEPVIDKERISVLQQLYRGIIRAVRSVDARRILFLEGNVWAQEIDFLKDLLGENIAVSIHSYHPLEFTFNFMRYASYPGTIGGLPWNRDALRNSLASYKEFSLKHNVPIYVGEFGVNYRENANGELQWVEDMVSIFREFGFSWTYWTYKAVSNSVFPDGIVQYVENPAWVRREGVVYGWENYPALWKDHKKEIVESFDSARFRENEKLVEILRRYFNET